MRITSRAASRRERADEVAVSAGYVQKLFGYDATATSAFFVGASLAVPLAAHP